MAYEWLRRRPAPRAWIDKQTEGDVVLSQFGTTRKGFPCRPRLEGISVEGKDGVVRQRLPEVDLSMLEGRLTAEQAFRAVLGRPPKRRKERDEARVRWFRVKRLWDCGLGVYRSPSSRNPNHVSVVPDPKLEIGHDDLAANAKFWDDQGSDSLGHACEEVSDG